MPWESEVWHACDVLHPDEEIVPMYTQVERLQLRRETHLRIGRHYMLHPSVVELL